MTKAATIMRLHAEGLSTREIALEVYALDPSLPWDVLDRKMAYVRVVIRQRKGTRQSQHDQRYLANGGQTRQRDRFKERYEADPVVRLTVRKSVTDWQRQNREKYLAYQRHYSQHVRPKKRLAESLTTD